MNPLEPRPAQVHNARALAELFGEVKAWHHQVEMKGREVLAAAKAAGQKLLAIKAGCRHGKWLATLDRFMPGQRREAQRYMLIAQNWHKVHAAGSISEALAWLSIKVDDPDEPEEAKNDTHDVFDGTDEGGEEAEGQGVTSAPVDLSAVRTREYVGRALRQLVAARELISEAYAGGAAPVLDDLARARLALLTLKHDGGIVKHGTTDGGAEAGVKRVTNDAIDNLIWFLSAAKAQLDNAERGE